MCLLPAAVHHAAMTETPVPDPNLQSYWIRTRKLMLVMMGLWALFSIVIPLLGHATWHLYRQVIVPDPAAHPVIPPARPRKPAADFPANLFPWKRG